MEGMGLIIVQLIEGKIKNLVRKAKLLNPICKFVASGCVGYFFFTLCYLWILKEDITNERSVRINLSLLMVSAFACCVMILCKVALVLINERVKEFFMRENTISALIHIGRFLFFFAYLGLTAFLMELDYKNELIVHVISAFILFTFFTSLSLWVVEDMRLYVLTNTVFLSFLYKGDFRIWYWVVAFGPPTKYLIIPFGSFLSDWADPPKKGSGKADSVVGILFLMFLGVVTGVLVAARFV